MNNYALFLTVRNERLTQTAADVRHTLGAGVAATFAKIVERAIANTDDDFYAQCAASCTSLPRIASPVLNELDREHVDQLLAAGFLTLGWQGWNIEWGRP